MGVLGTCAAGRVVEQQRQQRALRQPEQQQPRQLEQQQRFPVCPTAFGAVKSVLLGQNWVRLPSTRPQLHPACPESERQQLPSGES